MDLIDKAADSVPQGERGLLLRLFACLHYLDANRTREAITRMEAAEVLYDQSIFERPQDICAEFMFVKRILPTYDLACVLKCGRNESRLCARWTMTPDYWRAQTALHWLKGQREEAIEAWERGNALAQQLPSAGTYEFTRSCFEELRVVLDAPAQRTPPPLACPRFRSSWCPSKPDPVVFGARFAKSSFFSAPWVRFVIRGRSLMHFDSSSRSELN